MNDYKQLFGYAAILFGIGFVIRSFMPAYAFNGPHVSTGSNPIEFAAVNCDNSTNMTIFTNGTSQDFVVTDVWAGDGTVNLLVDNTIIMEGVNTSYTLESGLKLGSGSKISCSDTGGSAHVVISGYYSH